jgi:hypothetical protein
MISYTLASILIGHPDLLHDEEGAKLIANSNFENKHLIDNLTCDEHGVYSVEQYPEWFFEDNSCRYYMYEAICFVFRQIIPKYKEYIVSPIFTQKEIEEQTTDIQSC